MPSIVVNGVRLRYDLHGNAGPPLVLLHGSWGNRHAWDAVAPALAERCRVLAYDRRGHSESERPATPGSIDEDGDDLAALIEALGPAPAFVASNSSGGSIALRLATRRPELVRGLIAHEPPLLDLLEGDPALEPVLRQARADTGAVAALLAEGRIEEGTRRFIERVALGPGAWDRLSPAGRRVVLGNALTFLDEMRDPSGYTVDLAALAAFPRPTLLTYGERSQPFYRPIVARLAAALPRCEVRLVAGAGHVPMSSHPDEYAAAILDFVGRASC